MPPDPRRTAPPPPGPAPRDQRKGAVDDPAPTPPEAAKPTARPGDISSGVPDPAVTPPPRELPEGLQGGNKGFAAARTADRFPGKRPRPKTEPKG